MRRAATLIAALAVTLGSVGCGPSPQKEARDARTRAGSWAAAVKVAVEQWSIDIVPRHFVISMLEAAANDLASEAARVRSKAGDQAAAPLDRVRVALPQLADLVKRSDETAAMALASRLVAQVPSSPTPPRGRPAPQAGLHSETHRADAGLHLPRGAR